MAEFGRQLRTLHRPLRYSELSQNNKVIVEYIWIGGTGYDLRSKSRVFSKPEINSLDEIPEWNYDGSSTGQAEGTHSEVRLQPKVMWNDPIRGGKNLLVLCETFLSNGEPANSNFRVECKEIMDKAAHEAPWFGIEQEYILFNTQVTPPWPIGFPAHGYPTPQGPYYCGVGADLVFGREIAEAHLRLCLAAGLNISGTNVEVFPGQLEFQIGPNEGITAGDEVWVARYLLLRVAEMYGVGVSFAPKPIAGDWNGSGAHTNYSTNSTRADGGIQVLRDYIEKLEVRHKAHIEVYGEENDKRLTGKHETAPISNFRWGVGDRGASVRIPTDTEKAGKGYFEDRRPAGNIDPYVVTSMLVATTLLSGSESDRLYQRYKALHPRVDYF